MLFLQIQCHFQHQRLLKTGIGRQPLRIEDSELKAKWIVTLNKTLNSIPRRKISFFFYWSLYHVPLSFLWTFRWSVFSRPIMKKTEEQRGEVFDSILNLWLYIERIKIIIVDEFRGEPRLLFSCNFKLYSPNCVIGLYFFVTWFSSWSKMGPFVKCVTPVF